MDTSSKDSEKQTANDSGFLSLPEEDLSPEKKKPRLNKQTAEAIWSDELPLCVKNESLIGIFGILQTNTQFFTYFELEDDQNKGTNNFDMQGLEIVPTPETTLLSVKVYLSALSDRIQSVLDLAEIDVELHSASDRTSLEGLQKELLELLDELDLENLEWTSKTVEIDERLPQRKEEIEKLVKKLSQKTVDDHLKFTKDLKFSDYLGKVIGLKNSVIHTILDDQSDIVMKHCGIEEIIHTYFDNINEANNNDEASKDNEASKNNEASEDNEANDNQEDQLTQFEALGFSKSIATYLSSQMVVNCGKNLFTVLELAHRFLENLFLYNLMLTNLPKQLAHYTVNLNGDSYQMPNGATQSTTIYVNCKSTDEIPKEGNANREAVTTEMINQIKSGDVEGYEFWYHATSSVHADSIRERGIILNEGNKKLDFSHGKGFYLSDTLEAALDFTTKQAGAPVTAIMGYKFPPTFFSSVNRNKKLELTHDELDQWKNVVSFFRTGQNHKIPPALVNTLNKVHYIKGPISSWGEKNTKTARFYNDTWIQLCICNETLSKEANEHLDFILFIRQ